MLRVIGSRSLDDIHDSLLRSQRLLNESDYIRESNADFVRELRMIAEDVYNSLEILEIAEEDK